LCEVLEVLQEARTVPISLMMGYKGGQRREVRPVTAHTEAEAFD